LRIEMLLVRKLRNSKCGVRSETYELRAER
jgi:hypothetical protein